MQQLGQALSSGNLAQSQVAYNNITALGQGGPFANGNPFRVSQREQDFTAIGQALQSGDLAGAQQAFTTLQQTFRGQSPQPVSSYGAAPTSAPNPTIGPEVVINLSSGSTSPSATTAPGSTASGPEIVLNVGSGSTGSPASTAAASTTNGPEIVLNLNDGNSANPEQVTINVGNSSNGGGEQISISVGNQASNAPQVTLNLSANSNEEIVLNLLNATSTSAGSSSAGGGLNVSA